MQQNRIEEPVVSNTKVQDEESAKKKKIFWSQHLASVTLSILMILVGLANGWSSPYLAKLSLRDSVDGIPMASDTELTWVASLMNIGRIFGAAAGAVAQDTIGRKMSLCFASLPMMSGWICIAVAVSIRWLYAARLLWGFAMGMIWTTLSLYLAEIADPEIRGSLVLWNITVQSIGVFVGNLIGPYISMRTFAYISLVPNVLFLVLFPQIPDTPYRHVMTGDLDKAETSLRWFRRRDDVKQELQELQDYCCSSKISLMERLAELKQPAYRNSFLMMLLINVFSFFGAYNVTNNYMEIIVTRSETSVTPSHIVTLTGFFSIISGLVATFLVDRFGRRFLLVLSSLGMAVSLTSLGLHFQLLDRGFDPANLTLLPGACLLIYTMSYNAGCGSIPSALGYSKVVTFGSIIEMEKECEKPARQLNFKSLSEYKRKIKIEVVPPTKVKKPRAIVDLKEMKKELKQLEDPPTTILEKQLSSNRLPYSFYDVPCTSLAKNMLGKLLVRQLENGIVLKGRIVETESYLGIEDKASHTYGGKVTPRNIPMFMPPGTIYVYFTYGMYHCFNISSQEEGSAVLIRSLEPIEGVETMIENRSRKPNGKELKKSSKEIKLHEICNGPSKTCMALNLDRSHTKYSMCDWKGLWIEDDGVIKDMEIVECPRIGIDSVGKEWSSKPLRFYIYGHKCVSKRDKNAEALISKG
ncbi:hypothetical protein QAD02_009045 [Eretmocerus hayati]|uniref:Uncharacterized protein n=1 Tax=Eretmocerus hayati TaxID=131215 RepID=A0ACC2N9H2_9HYME|nr:hypothetical protein QAD02_009045 [Eretmocerus hayati]